MFICEESLFEVLPTVDEKGGEDLAGDSPVFCLDDGDNLTPSDDASSL